MVKQSKMNHRTDVNYVKSIKESTIIIRLNNELENQKKRGFYAKMDNYILLVAIHNRYRLCTYYNLFISRLGNGLVLASRMGKTMQK